MTHPRRHRPDMIERARRLAEAAHRGQFDHGKRPYIEHPTRVATYVHLTSLWVGLDPEEQYDAIVAAWLHDVLEDSSYTVHDLKRMGFSARAIEAVVLLTRTKDVPEEEYYRLISEHRVALAAKWADIIDNTDPYRQGKLSDARVQWFIEKYERGAACLKIPSTIEWWAQQEMWGPQVMASMP